MNVKKQQSDRQVDFSEARKAKAEVEAKIVQAQLGLHIAEAADFDRYLDKWDPRSLQRCILESGGATKKQIVEALKSVVGESKSRSSPPALVLDLKSTALGDGLWIIVPFWMLVEAMRRSQNAVEMMSETSTP